MGWGGEASRLTVELVRDQCNYPSMRDATGAVISVSEADDAYTNDRKNNTLPKDENGNSIIPGKVYYVPSGNKLVSKYWTGADPGFYADLPPVNGVDSNSIDIIGCAVYFKYDDFEFNGVVKSWENTGGTGGTKTYSVSIESPAFLLSQTQVILGDYIGAISVKGVAPNFPNHSFPAYQSGTYVGDIANQTIPNVINVYGYLEDITNVTTGLPVDDNDVPIYGYGSSGRNDEGIQAINILSGLNDLLGSPDVFNPPKTKVLRYSPFGRIIGIAPKTKHAVDDIAFSPAYSMGLIPPHVFPPTSQTRMGYSIDISEIIGNGIIPPFYRLSDNKLSVLEIIQNICDNTGQELFISLELQIINGIIYPRIKVNTFSTLAQPPAGAVQSYISTLASRGTIVSSYSKGEEFNNTKPVRTMLIGGKQQRLYQVKNSKYAAKQSTLRYNPYTNVFMQINHYGGVAQQYRLVDPTNIRCPGLYQAVTSAYSFGRVPLYANKTSQRDLWGASIDRGNYFAPMNVSPIGAGTFSPGGSDYPASDSDAICPFFGKDDLTGVVRPVFSHYGKTANGTPSGGGGVGFLVGFSSTEIGAAIGRNFSFNDRVRVSETEIRAAMSGFDAYVGFIGGVVGELNGSGLDIWTKILGPILGPNALRTMMQGIGSTFNKYTNSQSGSNTVPMNARSSIMTDPSVFEILTKLQEYFKKIGDEFYGKKFMVSIPTPSVGRWFWTDSQPFEASIVIGQTLSGQPIYLSQGSQKTYYAYEPTDSAWEEPFNWIDDTLLVGNAEMDALTKEDGSIEPILGYNNSAQYNYPRALNQMMFDWIKNQSTANQLSEFWKFDAYRAAGIASPSFNLWEPSLILNDSDKLIKSYALPMADAFGQTIPQGYVSKVYVKATVDKQFYPHVTQTGKIVAKIIISADPVFINPMNPDAHSVQTALAEFLHEDYANYSSALAARSRKILSVSDKYVGPAQYSSGSFSAENTLSQSRDNKQYNNLSIHPKAAIPGFAAVPLVLNNASYGPWVSAPDLIKNDIFGSNNFPDLRLENLVGGVNLEINSDLVPWNYGGMRVLDEAALMLVGQNNEYQTKGETGQLTVYGVPEFSLGSELKSMSWAFRGPTINNIQLQIGESGASTTYTFRTFTRKFTLFNKDSSDRLKNMGQNAIRLGREFRQQSRSIINKILSMGPSNSTVSSYDLTGSKLRAYSPMSILVGYSSPYISPKTTLSPGFYNRPQWSGDSIRQLATVTLQDSRELSQEFDNLFSSKAFMSLEGLLHPVSFYPTLNASTTPYKPYYTSKDQKLSGCPVCGGTKQYQFSIGDNSTTLFCDFCTDIKAGEEKTDTATSSKLPPFILSNQADAQILKDPKALDNLISGKIKTKKIDYVNLNPIIMPVGELRNKYAQDNDYASHHIDVIGRSLVPPVGSLSITDNLAINQNGLEYKDQNAMDSDGDWNSYAFDQVAGRQPKFFQNNHRFLALRGPLVMAGWGFDTDGFPVPNASGEPKSVNAAGYPLRIKDKYDQNGGYADEGYGGSILGKNQVWNNVSGLWSDPTKESTFYKGWGLRPDTWPVGPVDLRWNESRKVWTASGSEMQLVDIQLEDNLVPPFPARGFIYKLDKTSPLPSGLRRMVFVKDSSNTYGAPRGAKLLCYYDEGSGFYEPVTKQNIIAYGEIQSDGVATIYDAYARGFDPDTNEPEPPEPLKIEFTNDLNYSINKDNQPGFFMFSRNQWVLLNTNSCS